MPESELNWSRLIVGSLSREEILEAVRDPQWQDLRMSLQYTKLTYRYERLESWLIEHPGSRRHRVQVANYVNALKRGGVI